MQAYTFNNRFDNDDVTRILRRWIQLGPGSREGIAPGELLLDSSCTYSACNAGGKVNRCCNGNTFAFLARDACCHYLERGSSSARAYIVKVGDPSSRATIVRTICIDRPASRVFCISNCCLLGNSSGICSCFRANSFFALVQELRQRHRSQDADDDDHDHQLHQGEALGEPGAFLTGQQAQGELLAEAGQGAPLAQRGKG